MKPLTFKGYQDFQLGCRSYAKGKNDAKVPILLFPGDLYPSKVLQAKRGKSVTEIFLPDQSKAIIRQSLCWSAKLAEVGNKVLNRLLGYRQVVDADLACNPTDLAESQKKDIFVVQDYAPGVSVHRALLSKRGKSLVARALDKPDNLIPFYLHMVLSGDSDRHNENMNVDNRATLRTYDFEYSGGYDFYMHPGYESFTTQPVMEDRFALFIPFREQDFATLRKFQAERHQNEDSLLPYYDGQVVDGMFERARILENTGSLMPTHLLFPLIRDTFKAPDS